MTQEKIDQLTAAVREALKGSAPDDVLDKVLEEFGLVIAESAITGETIDDLIAYIKLEGFAPMVVTVVKEREEVDDCFFDFRPPH